MLKNFNTINEQLKDLSRAINAFESENVQVRVVELLFEKFTDKDAAYVAPTQVAKSVPAAVVTAEAPAKRPQGRPRKEGTFAPTAIVNTEAPAKRPQGRPRKDASEVVAKAPKVAKPKAPVNVGAGRGRASKDGLPGASKVLTTLVSEGNFFKSPRSIFDILNHTNGVLGRSFKPNELSGILIKFIREEKLTRAKNPQTGQYEYTVS